MKKLFLVFACSALPYLAYADAGGDKIISDADALNRGYGGSVGTAEMINSDGRGGNSLFTISTSTKEFPDGQNKTVMRFIKPAEDNGTVFLVHGKDGPDDQWIFLPKQKRMKKISGSLKNSAFLGGEFTFSDLSDSKVSDYTNQLTGDQVVEGVDCFVIERTPVDSGDDYLKVVNYIEKDRLLTLKIEYFNKRGELLKTAAMSNHSKGEDGRWRPLVVVMKSATTGKSTTFKTIDFRIDANIPDAAFNISTISSGG